MSEKMLSGLPSAAEAANRVEMGDTRKAQAEARGVMQAITRAIENGELSVGITPPIQSDALRHELKQLGYEVENRQCGWNETETRVSW